MTEERGPTTFTMLFAPGYTMVVHFFLIYMVFSGVISGFEPVYAVAIVLLVLIIWLVAMWWIVEDFYNDIRMYMGVSN